MKTQQIKYPQITVKLTGEDGNAFNILGIVTKALKKGNVPLKDIQQFHKEATDGDYNHLIVTCNNWVNLK